MSRPTCWRTSASSPSIRACTASHDALGMTMDPGVAERARNTLLVRGTLGSGVGRWGIAIVGAITLLALAGPWFSPYSPTDTMALPLDAPTTEHLLGTDGLGRDVLSRYLHGGRVL